MPKKAKINEKALLPESEEHLRELLKKIYLNEVPLETKKKEAREPLYLVRYAHAQKRERR